MGNFIENAEHTYPWYDYEFKNYQDYSRVSLFVLDSLKTKDRQFDNFVVIGGTVITPTYGATSDDKVVKLTIFCF